MGEHAVATATLSPGSRSPPLTRLSALSLLALLTALAFFPRSALPQSGPLQCAYWAQQSALDGPGRIIYLQGGRRRTESGQAANTWFNSLLALRVDANWPTSSPSLTVLQEGRDNPPALALGALFSDRQGENLYLIGGQTSDTPVVTPPETAIWRFDVGRGSWSSPSTSGQTLRRAAEGAAAIVAGAGSDGQPIAIQGFGHVDSHTDPSHSPSTPRNYLSSLTMFDIGSLSLATSGSATSAATGTGNSTARGTPAPRADGTLTYVPGMGTDGKGILVSLGGGTADSLLDNDNLDVYDLGAQGWARQPTLGTAISPRMNHCAVRGSANVNGATHHHIIVFGGQNLDQSRQYSDVAILTLPSFTWTQLGSLASGPSPRAGHTCELVGSQLVVVGGWLGSRLPCDSAPVSVFDTTTGTWTTSFQAGSTFTTPVMARNITGGTGQASKDTSATSSSPNQTTADSGAGTAGDEAETSGQDDEGGAVGGNGGSNNGNDAPTGGNGSIGGDGVVNTPGDGDQPGQGGRMHDSDDDSNSKVGPIVGGILGIAAAIALLAAGIIALRRWRRRRQVRAGGMHARLLSDAHSIASDDASIFSDVSSVVGVPYSGLPDRPSMAAIPTAERAYHPPPSAAIPPVLAFASRPSSSGHYSRVSLEDTTPSSSNYMASGSSIQHGSDEPSSDWSHRRYDPATLPPSSNTSSSSNLRAAWTDSSYLPTPESQPSSYLPHSASSHSKPLGPRPLLALRTRAPEVDPFSDASAVDGHEALSRASTGKTDNTKSSGIERNMRDFEVTMDAAASPRFSKRMTLVVANPSSSASGDDSHSM